MRVIVFNSSWRDRGHEPSVVIDIAASRLMADLPPVAIDLADEDGVILNLLSGARTEPDVNCVRETLRGPERYRNSLDNVHGPRYEPASSSRR